MMDSSNAPTLNIDDRMLETVNERIQQAKAKGAIARARLRLQQNVTQATPSEDHITPDEVDWVAETEAVLADENSGK
jgi:DNA-binding SARP family transcriptional activator